MPAGKALVAAVAEKLPDEGIGITSGQIAAQISSASGKRALRYALKRLVDRGIAKRDIGLRGEFLYRRASPCVLKQRFC